MIKSSTRPWKKSLETIPTTTCNSLISLYDLFYDSEGKFWINSSDSMAGCALEHDIICLNQSMLKSDNSIDTSKTPTMNTSTWYNFGIDVSIPIFDARSKRKIIECNAAFGKESTQNIFPKNKFAIYDKDAALEPNNIEVFTLRGVMSKIQTGEASWDNYLPPSIAPFQPGMGTEYNSADIILSAPDNAFKSTLVMQDGYSSYNRMFVNPYSWFGVSLVAKATGMSLNNVLSTESPLDNKSSTFPFSTYDNFWNQEADALNPRIAAAINIGDDSTQHTSTDTTTLPNKDMGRWQYLLKNTYVWVRAPFFADYIKPDNFEQDLTPDAKVVHNELMLTGAADFKKYDIFATSSLAKLSSDETSVLDTQTKPGVGGNKTSVDSLGLSELTMPYVPKTSPTIDIYTSRLLDNLENLQGIKAESSDNTNYSSKISVGNEVSDKINNFLDNDAAGNDMIIRGLPVSAINRDNSINSSQQESLIPPNWFDPETRFDGDHYRQVGKFPTVVPKDGNLYVDGRIISPSIDEIWIMLKKLTGGRLSDVNSKGRAETLDMGIPLGTNNNLNDTDTTLTEVPDSEFNFSYKGSDTLDKHGDPIDFVYENNNTSPSSGEDSVFNQTLKITKFVNQNDTISYPVYSSLKLLSDDINNLRGDNTERVITNFTAWKVVSKKGETIGDGSSVSIDNKDWGPRAAPYSLRELEAMIKGNKYNIITQARFVKENFAVTGGLGKISGYNKDDMSNFTAGSLYQMHMNYNFDVANPNTFYNNAGTVDGTKAGQIIGARATLDDEDWRTEEMIQQGHIRFVENYGSSTALSENPELYSSSDVYLSAYGDWRYVQDHNRIPILRGEWI